MTDNPWVAPGSAPPPEPPRADPTAPPSDAVPPPSYPAPPPGYVPPPGAGPRPPAYAGLEFRPGIIPLRPLGLGDVYGAVTKAVRGNVAATMGLALLTSLACLIPFTALGAWVASQETISIDSEEFGLFGVIGSYLPTLGSLLATIALTGFLAYVIGQAVLGRRVGIGETWDGTKGRLPALALAVVMTLVGGLALLVLLFGVPLLMIYEGGVSAGPVVLLVLASLAAVVVYLWLWTRTAFVTSVIVLEGRGAVTAFARSWRLTSGTPFWRILGIRLLTAVIVGTVAQVIVIPIALFGVLAVLALGGEEQIFMWQAVLGGVSSLVSAVITTPFSAGVDALLTIDQRIRREGLDVQLIHTAQHGGPAPWPSAARDH